MSIKPIPILIPPTPIIYTYTPNSPPPATSKNQASVALSTWALSWQSLAFSLCVWPTLGVDHQWGTTRRSTPSQVRKRFFPKMEKAGLHLFGGGHFSSKCCVFVGDVLRISTMGFIATKLPFFGNEASFGTFSKLRGKSKNMTPPQQVVWCSVVDLTSRKQKIRPKPGAVDKKMLEKIVLVKRFPLDFCEQVAGWFIEIFKWLIITPIQLGRISSPLTQPTRVSCGPWKRIGRRSRILWKGPLFIGGHSLVFWGGETQCVRFFRGLKLTPPCDVKIGSKLDFYLLLVNQFGGIIDPTYTNLQLLGVGFHWVLTCKTWTILELNLFVPPATGRVLPIGRCLVEITSYPVLKMGLTNMKHQSITPGKQIDGCLKKWGNEDPCLFGVLVCGLKSYPLFKQEGFNCSPLCQSFWSN